MDQEGRILANIDLSRRIYLAYRPLVCTYARLTLCSVGYASLTPLEPEMDGWHAWRNSPQPKKQLVAAASAAARVACLTSNCRLPVRWILRPDPICRWRSEAQPQQREALAPRRAERAIDLSLLSSVPITTETGRQRDARHSDSEDRAKGGSSGTLLHVTAHNNRLWWTGAGPWWIRFEGIQCDDSCPRQVDSPHHRWHPSPVSNRTKFPHKVVASSIFQALFHLFGVFSDEARCDDGRRILGRQSRLQTNADFKAVLRGKLWSSYY
jgi:hypothetical protein